MIAAFFTTYIRTLLKRKTINIMNICGLAIGMASFILLALYTTYEFSYDQFWQKSDQLYKIHTTLQESGKKAEHYNASSGKLKQTLADYFPTEIASVIRMMPQNLSVSIQDKKYRDPFVWTDPELTKMFDLTLIAGDLNQALADTNSIGLSRSVAHKYFGTTNAIGKRIGITIAGKQKDMIVKAVYEDTPNNSTFYLPAFLRISDTPQGDNKYYFDDWYYFYSYIYVLLNEGTKPEAITNRFPALIDASVVIDKAVINLDADANFSDYMILNMFPVKDIHLHTGVGDDFLKVSDYNTVVLFSVIAVLILLVSVVNYMNLTSAQMIGKSKNVMIRKVMGASPKHIFGYYFTENLLHSLIAIILAVSMVELALPTYNAYIDRPLQLDLASIEFISFGLMLTGFTAVAGGLFPTVALSKINPASILLSNKSGKNMFLIGLGKALMVFQFTVTIALLIGLLAIQAQKQHMDTMDLGFNKSGLLNINNMRRAAVKPNRLAFQNEIAQLPTVVRTSYGGSPPSANLSSTASLIHPESPDYATTALQQVIGYDFFDTYQIKLLAGRLYQKDKARDAYQSIRNYKKGDIVELNMIINQLAAQELGYSNPQDIIGKVMHFKSNNGVTYHYTIIGVVENTTFQSIKAAQRPYMYYLYDAGWRSLTVRFNGDRQTALESIQATWNKFYPDEKFHYTFIEDYIDEELANENRLTLMLSLFSALSVMITIIGLMAISAYTTESKTKEISIRKVLGANTAQIMRYLTWQYSKPVLLANIFAWPLALWGLMAWLETFPYRLDLIELLPIAAIASLLTLFIAWLTTGGLTFRAARQKPSNALRQD